MLLYKFLLHRPPGAPISVHQFNKTAGSAWTPFYNTMVQTLVAGKKPGEYRAHFVGSLFLMDHSPVLPVAQYLKTLVAYIFSSSYLFIRYVRQEETSFIPVTLSWTKVEVSKPFNTELI